jgi:predicted permease
MSPVAAALIPVFAVILIGYSLRETRLVADEHWPAIDHLNYFVLFPVLIIKTLAVADLSSVPVMRVAAAMLAAICSMAGLLFLLRKPLSLLLGVAPAGFTSVFQGVTRWHTFVAYSIIAALYGAPGIAVTSIGLAVMTPVLNLLNVGILARYGRHPGDIRPSPLRLLARNPFIISCLIGIALNATGLRPPEPALAAMDLIGRAALGTALLSVGAALRLGQAFGQRLPVVATGTIRLVGMPLLMLGFGRLLDIGAMPLVIAAICGGVPTASSGYILARQMGGDAELMASIITFQVLAAALTLPLAIWLATLLTNS